MFPGDPGETWSAEDFVSLADAYHEHSLPLIERRHGISAPLTAGQVAAHALADLALIHALTDRVLPAGGAVARLAG